VFSPPYSESVALNEVIREGLTVLIEMGTRALADLPDVLTEAQLRRQRELVAASRRFVDASLAAGRLSGTELRTYARITVELIEANVADAAAAALEAY
jgi:hypothetical protein